jgi:hypothetical protein
VTATETATEMTMQVTAKTDGRRISELCSTRCAKNSLLPYIQGQVDACVKDVSALTPCLFR